MKKLDPTSFSRSKREELLDYKVYSYNFDDNTETFEIVSEDISQSADVLATIPASNLMEATREPAWQATDHLQNCYSAGHGLAELRSIFPALIGYWEDYAHFSRVFKESEEAKHVTVGHVALAGNDYHSALMMVCLGILLGWRSLLGRLVSIPDYRNDSHKRRNHYSGNWCWEAAAITVVLEIDDENYREAEFYPCDLADFAAEQSKSGSE